MARNKGQEEIVGFVLIVVLVTIVLVVFLGILLRQEGNNTAESSEVWQFLGSISEYTTECAISYEPDFYKFDELVRSCQKGEMCLSGKSACKVLNDTSKGLIGASWSIGLESYIKGYEFKALSENGEQKEMIFRLSKGNCTGAVRGADRPLPNTNNVTIYLNLCY